MRFDSPVQVMRHALELAQKGLGFVEPNPPVGAVIVNDQLELLGEGWHQKFGGPHAEIHAIQAAGDAAHGATLYVTLEPCCHAGKTPPCTQAILAAGIQNVVVATKDPNPQVAGRGGNELSAAGLIVELGLLREEAETLIGPFSKLMTRGLPWLIAKWAMTLDGKLATRTGDSRWISNEASRQIVHELRGRMDAIVVGLGTALADDPRLTARPAGPRTALRIVVDRRARLPLSSQLVTTAKDVPVLVATGPDAPEEKVAALKLAGVEVLRLPAGAAGEVSLPALCEELGRRRFTNVLIEGGSRLLGTCFDQRLIDEVYAFVAPKLVGGAAAPGPIGGGGVTTISNALQLKQITIRNVETDVLINGLIAS